MKKIIFLAILLISSIYSVKAQDDLMDIFCDEEVVDYTTATFKTTRLALGFSVENPAKSDMIFIISHHFGKLSGGAYEFFGLDQATMRLGFEYGITDRLTVGIGRSTYNKTYDGFLKYKLLRQSKGAKTMPITLNLVSGVYVNSLKWPEPDRENYFSSRMSYMFQALVARKFNKRLSLQLMPTIVHKNLVATAADHNDIISIGGGGRYKFTNRSSVNIEYYYVLPDQIVSYDYVNSLTVGFDIETGGHVFQLFFSNSVPINTPDFITQTNEKWTDGGIYFGFNIARVFTIGKN
ncbi:MAG: hypothetical protein GQ527_12275 [Bacteroidales bacterium]|nr:hypothetical protein [Bacteroidales bacterium]